MLAIHAVQLLPEAVALTRTIKFQHSYQAEMAVLHLRHRRSSSSLEHFTFFGNVIDLHFPGTMRGKRVGSLSCEKLRELLTKPQ